MRQLTTALAALLVLSVARLAHAQDLERIDSPTGTGPPLWLSAAQAVEGFGGALREDVLGGEAVQSIRQGLGSGDGSEVPVLEGIKDVESYLQEHPCDTITVTSGDAPPLDGMHPPGPLSLAFAAADLVVWGNVEDHTAGFLAGGRLASLYRLRVQEWVRIPDGAERASSIYMTFDSAKAVIEGRVWCLRGSRHPESPTVGREVLLMARSSAVLHTNTVVLESYPALYFETEGAGVSSPEGTPDAPREWSALVDYVRRLGQ
jgi:hypothetical protein